MLNRIEEEEKEEAAVSSCVSMKRHLSKDRPGNVRDGAGDSNLE